MLETNLQISQTGVCIVNENILEEPLSDVLGRWGVQRRHRDTTHRILTIFADES